MANTEWLNLVSIEVYKDQEEPEPVLRRGLGEVHYAKNHTHLKVENTLELEKMMEPVLGAPYMVMGFIQGLDGPYLFHRLWFIGSPPREDAERGYYLFGDRNPLHHKAIDTPRQELIPAPKPARPREKIVR